MTKSTILHISRLKFYHDGSLDKYFIISNLFTSENSMVVQIIMNLVDTDNGLMVLVLWRRFTDSEDTVQAVAQIYKDVPKMVLKLLRRKNTPHSLAEKYVQKLRLE